MKILAAIIQRLADRGFEPTQGNIVQEYDWIVEDLMKELEKAKAGEVAGWNRPPGFVSPPTKFGVQHEREE